MYRKNTCQGAKWVFLLVLLCLGLTAGAQTSKKVTLQLTNASLKEVFLEIKSQANVGFMYSEKAMANLPRKDYHFKQESISKILNYALAGSDYTFEMENNRNIIIYKKSTDNITGKVIDGNGEPMVGVSVLPIGTTKVQGAATDLEGKFSFPANGLKSVKLRFSFIGAKSQDATWNGKALKIVLDDDVRAIDEVVVTGYQTIDRRKVTASITSVKMDDVLMPNMTTVDQALEGHIPDLLFIQNSGEAGSTARLRVRGTSTIVGNREPLWVLDGFPLSDPVNVTPEQLNDPDYINYVGNAISGINPQDIERIDVLKDAAATALYGTRASNGVIVVTTKKGHEGKPTIRYNTNVKYTRRPRYTDHAINLMNSQERVQFGKDLCDLHYVFPQYMPMVEYEGALYRYQTGQTGYNEFLNEVRNYETVNTDWFDLLCEDAITHSHTLSISGGSKSTRYYTSVGYTREGGTVKTEFVDRYTASMNLNTEINKNLKANIRVNANIQKKNHLPSDVKVLNYAYETTRALPAYNADGSLYYYKKHGYSVGNGRKTNNLYDYNILNEVNNTSDDYSGNTFSTNGELVYNLKNIVNFTLGASYSRSATNQSTWYGENSNYVAILKNGEATDIPQTGTSGYCELPYGGVYNTTNTTTESFTGRLQANAHYAFGEDRKHLISSTVGYEVSTYRSNGITDQTRGYYKERGMQYSTMEGADLDNYPLYKNWLAEGHRSLSAAKTNTLSGYLTLAYDYKRYFTVSLNGRFDASNKFGSRSNEKFLPVWSISGRWSIKDTFFNESRAVNNWIIRMSYGKTGNMLDNETPNMLIRQGTMDAYYGENVSTVSAFPNPNLRWEQTSTTNFGTELSMFDDRLQFTGELWFKHTTDAFSTINIASTNGRTSYKMNNGTINNYGYSLWISGYPIRTQDWELYLSTTYSWASNTVKSGTNENYSLNDYLNGTAIVDGEAIGTFYSYKYLGLNPNTGIPMFDDYQDRRHLLMNQKLADIIPLVMTASGNRDPKLTGSFYATLKWKQLSLNMNFNYRIGCKVRLFDLYTPIVSGISSDKNVRKEFVDRWMKPGDERYTDIPALISPSDDNYSSTMSHWSNGESAKVVEKVPTFAENVWKMYDRSDLRVVSGDYLRMSNLRLTYRFKHRQLKNTPLKSLDLSLAMTNVFTIASGKLKGQDPTQANSTTINMSLRPAYTFALNVSF